ncbi:MAG: ComEA family DNA-binding protein [Candidatus Aerophobetes bacterium]|nr:ComEA family DNA-binding protein [Candidatus Aerophobetes bacterium]
MGIKLTGGIPHTDSLPQSQKSVKVKIIGAVRRPGWYTLPEKSLLIEGIKKAGGVSPQADLNGLKLSSFLKNEERVYIPPQKIDINRASLPQLTHLPGIGPVLAQRIIDYRREKGKFRTLLELQDVPGIGEKKLQQIKDKITIE